MLYIKLDNFSRLSTESSCYRFGESAFLRRSLLRTLASTSQWRRGDVEAALGICSPHPWHRKVWGSLQPRCMEHRRHLGPPSPGSGSAIDGFLTLYIIMLFHYQENFVSFHTFHTLFAISHHSHPLLGSLYIYIYYIPVGLWVDIMSDL